VIGSGAESPTLEKTLITESEEAIAGYFSWQKLLGKARAHFGCRANDDDGVSEKNDLPFGTLKRDCVCVDNNEVPYPGRN
jgi:hypothetical protein